MIVQVAHRRHTGQTPTHHPTHPRQVAITRLQTRARSSDHGIGPGPYFFSLRRDPGGRTEDKLRPSLGDPERRAGAG